MIRGKNGKAVIIIVLALTLVVLISGVAVVMFKPFGHAKGKGKEKVDKGPAVMVALGEFVVNLADAGQIRYLKTDVVLELRGVEAAGGGHGEGEDPTKPRIRDAVICVMSSKSFSELIQSGGKKKLKEDIIKAVNEQLEEGEATEVFFNEFAMQ